MNSRSMVSTEVIVSDLGSRIHLCCTVEVTVTDLGSRIHLATMIYFIVVKVGCTGIA